MKCPGQDTQYWNPDAIFETPCPECGHVMEFFKDDTARRCPGCGKRQVNPRMDFGCAAYCQFAEQCLGTLPEGVILAQEDLLKDRVALEMKKYFGRDFKRIGHASKVARYAETIARAEGADLAVVLCAAFLHDIGIKNAEEKYQSASARYQEVEGPPVAEKILSTLGAKPALTEEVCSIIGRHHSPGPEETLNFKVLYDADLLTNITEGDITPGQDSEARAKKIDRIFFTDAGKALAKKVLIQNL